MAKTKAAAPKSELRETLTFLVKLALIVFVFRSFVLAPFSIPSESMLPRLLIGDYLFVSKWNYGYSRWSLPFGFPPVDWRVGWGTPARGDTVVFRGPAGEDHDVIKRVIGLPGDTIQMRRGQIILNGKPVPKQRIADFVVPLTPNFDARKCDAPFQATDETGAAICRYPRFRETLPGGRTYEVLDQHNLSDRDDTGVYQVPKGRVFLMGDNRDDSADSRFPAPADALPGEATGMGFIPVDHIEGRALVTFWSTDGSANYVLPWTWLTAARWSRIGHGFD